MGGSRGRSAGVEVAGIQEDQTAGKRVYDPSHPDADEQGYVTLPNVDTVTEMVDLIDAQRAYEANVTAMQASKQMFSKTLEILR
jgi:flagellar basal-body rod protein FlgC